MSEADTKKVSKKDTRNIPPQPHKFSFSIEFPDAATAAIVHKTVTVDEEIRPERCSRTDQLTANKLTFSFAAVDLKFLRVAVSSFIDSIVLTMQTIHAFHPFDAAAAGTGR